ncbi:MAG: YafY family transcriptional regulator [Chloroflexi bacterium]|nr:YafY family transcriptional regulator [Chloroflexota bacterium]
MYSPTTRLLTVLELLQARPQISGNEIARRLEVDLRTVRRYMVMLQDMGIPVEAERGPYGGYRLERGYKVPPLMFTDGEAIALTLGLLAMREFRFPVDASAVEGALAKTERVMPDKLLQQVRALQKALRFRVDVPPFQLPVDFVTPLSLAAEQGQRVFLRYRAWDGTETGRDFDPYGVVFNDGYWYTVGFCHLRQDLRTFRLDRILEIEPRGQTFSRPENFDTLGQVLQSLTLMPGIDEIEVILDTSLEHARQSLPVYLGRLEDSAQGVIFRRPAIQLEWVAHALVSCDFQVRVVQNDELRSQLRQIAGRASRAAGS